MRTAIATLAALAAVTLTGCNDDSTSESSNDNPGSNSASHSSPSTPSSDDELYLSSTRAVLHHDYSDYALIHTAHQVCTALDGGYTVQQVGTRGVLNGVDPYDMGVVIGGAVAVFCPEHQGALS